jgi:hypothetical protein
VDRQVYDTLLAAGKVVKLVKNMRILGNNEYRILNDDLRSENETLKI